MSLAAAFDRFFQADEAGPVIASFREVVELISSEVAQGLDLFAALCEKVEPAVLFKQQRIFQILREAITKREKTLQEADGEDKEDPRETKVLVSGAGPVGLRAAVENALLGHTVTIVEKRSEFSRVNVLLFWHQTMQDMISLGVKCFYPLLQTHGLLHMGTREIQLCLLKTALCLGVDVQYESELVGLVGSADGWKAHLDLSRSRKKTQRFSGKGIRSSLRGSLSGLKDALSFKPDKTADYQKTFKCNMIEDPQVDEGFLNPSLEDTTKLIPFNVLMIAEGEWSNTSRKLGVRKTVDRFKSAIGMVVNLEYDKGNKTEKGLTSFSLGFSPQANSVREELQNSGISIEGIEYLKGHTHYIVVTLSKETLLSHGVLKAPTRKGDGLRILREENIDSAKLHPLARLIASAVGLPESAKFCNRHSVQLFDFSTRARAIRPYRFLHFGSNGPKVVDDVPDGFPSGSSEPLRERSTVVPVMLIGDSLLEPFWPQGLGSNRGFHSALDCAYASVVLRRDGLEAFITERLFSYALMNCYAWRQNTTLRPFEEWTTDPLTRYALQVVRTTKQNSTLTLAPTVPGSSKSGKAYEVPPRALKY